MCMFRFRNSPVTGNFESRVKGAFWLGISTMGSSAAVDHAARNVMETSKTGTVART
eukprot:SAG31_NODE_585_length_13845_cov_25.623163_9_plen_56_part_00